MLVLYEADRSGRCGTPPLDVVCNGDGSLLLLYTTSLSLSTRWVLFNLVFFFACADGRLCVYLCVYCLELLRDV